MFIDQIKFGIDGQCAYPHVSVKHILGFARGVVPKMIVSFKFETETKNLHLSLNMAGTPNFLLDFGVYSEILHLIFGKSLIIDGIKVISMPRFMPIIVSGDNEANFRYSFCQNGKLIDEVPSKPITENSIVEVVNRSPYDVQIASQTFEIPDSYRIYDNVAGLIIISLKYDGRLLGHLEFDIVHWKQNFMNKIGNRSLNYKAADGNYLKADLPLDYANPLDFKCIDQRGEIIVIRAKFFMEFEAFTATPQSTLVAIEAPNLKRSFSRELTSVGECALKSLEYEIHDRFDNDLKADYYAPIVFIGQSSGSGKSKLAVELLKVHLGFYLVLRMGDQSGYPYRNGLSVELSNILNSYMDSNEPKAFADSDSCTIGKILHYLAKIIIQSYRKFFNAYKSLKAEDENITYEEVNRILASSFEDNDHLDFKLMDDVQLESVYQRLSPRRDNEEKTVQYVAEVIRRIISHPETLFDTEELNIMHGDKFQYGLFRDYPFVFVVDEADILANIKYQNLAPISNGFEALRRALSYLDVATKIVFLTIGTKSNIVDLNPPIPDSSMRSRPRRKMPVPIALRGNMNVFSNEYPISKLKLTTNLVLNPLFFKFLCTRGRPLWSSIPPENIVDLAVAKIKNHSATPANFVPVLWMILTGISANASSPEAGEFVANHMAFLMQIRENCQKMVVSFVSEPILALSAHSVVDSLTVNDDLFKYLQLKYESVDVDCGQLSEVFGSMTVLRAIWNSSRIDLSSNNRNTLESDFTESITNAQPDFESLWRRRVEYLMSPDLQPSASPSLDRIFPYYRIHTVAQFLTKLVEGSGANINEFGLPPETLAGYVNATHFIVLNRDFSNIEVEIKQGLSVKKIDLTSSLNLKSADNRIKDNSRNILTKEILKLAFLHSAGLRCPPGMYGFDLIVPVLLNSGRPGKDDDMTFIGIQIKRSDADTTSNIEKMQARLHLVKCGNPNCLVNPPCNHCIPNSALKKVYLNQITILMSLDDENTYNFFRSSTTYFEGCAANDKQHFLSMLESGADNLPQAAVQHGRSKRFRDEERQSSKSKRFLEPLVHVKKAFGNRTVMLSKTLWNDKYVEFGEAFEQNDRNAVSDNFIHRQYCICTRGWSSFRNFMPSNAHHVASELFNRDMPSRILEKDKTHDLASFIIRDSFIAFPSNSGDLNETFELSSLQKEMSDLVSESYNSSVRHRNLQVSNPTQSE